MPGTHFEFDLVGIGSVLKNRRLAVPIYQRSFAWGSDDPKERDQVTEFWADLRDSFGERDLEYFLGTVVLTREGADGRETIIDGQQRLATTAILLAAIRDEFKEWDDDVRANTVNNTFLAEADLRTGHEVPQIVLNADDDTFFRKFILQGDHSTTPSTESHELIGRAYEVLRDSIRVTADEAGAGWADRLAPIVHGRS